MTFILMHITAKQNPYHDAKSAWQCFTLVSCHRLIRNVRSCRRSDSSSIIAHPVNFDIQRARSLNCDAKNSTYIYICIDITLSIIDVDFLHQCNVRLHHFSQFFSMFTKKLFSKFSKVGRSVTGWRSGQSCCDLWCKTTECCYAFQRRSN